MSIQKADTGNKAISKRENKRTAPHPDMPPSGSATQRVSAGTGSTCTEPAASSTKMGCLGVRWARDRRGCESGCGNRGKWRQGLGRQLIITERAARLTLRPSGLCTNSQASTMGQAPCACAGVLERLPKQVGPQLSRESSSLQNRVV